ncbi:MAG: LPS assembly lipoprotein LptE [Gemmatimonadaceae bacterium]
MRRSGVERLVVVLVLCACMPYGFAGGGLPAHIRTVAVLPFDNETADPSLQRELLDRMKREVESRLGLRTASESNAHAIVRGRVVRYDVDIPIAYSADPDRSTTARRKLQITLDVEIVDQTTGRTLWVNRNLTAEGEYSERAEASGRRQAVEKLVNDIIDGAQSQW